MNKLDDATVIKNLLEEHDKKSLQEMLIEWRKPWSHYTNPYKKQVIRCLNLALSKQGGKK